MKILAIHNFHRKGSASGDDQVFKSETKLLEDYGHDVIRFTVSNDEFDRSNGLKKMFAAFGMLWSSKYYSAVKKIINETNPDIVHVHTFFPLLSPSILYAASKFGCKVVATLHDTRFICPCATSLRDMNICNKCGAGNYLYLCKYKCFKNSFLQSCIVAVIFGVHRFFRTFYRKIDQYICLNQNQINLLTGIGFDSEKITRKYNFVPDTKIDDNLDMNVHLPERYAVYWGRIGEEKGIHQLMKMWDKLDDIPLVVMGAGPLFDEFSQWASTRNNIYNLGYTQHDQCLKIAGKAQFLIFPSICYEGCSMVQIEAESLGLPIIATKLGFSEESIVDGYNGYKVELGNTTEFVARIQALWADPNKCAQMGLNARDDYEQKYMPEENYEQLMTIYQKILGA